MGNRVESFGEIKKYTANRKSFIKSRVNWIKSREEDRFSGTGWKKAKLGIRNKIIIYTDVKEVIENMSLKDFTRDRKERYWTIL